MISDKFIKEPEEYKQFMFHFHYPKNSKNSIDARNISPEDLKQCLCCLEQYEKYNVNQLRLMPNFTGDCKTIRKMFSIWFPEYLI